MTILSQYEFKIKLLTPYMGIKVFLTLDLELISVH